MKRLFTLLLLCLFAGSIISCNTQKPAEEVEDAKSRVQDKVQHAHDNQEAENPEAQKENSDSE
jgi:hypothetical protein